MDEVEGNNGEANYAYDSESILRKWSGLTNVMFPLFRGMYLHEKQPIVIVAIRRYNDPKAYNHLKIGTFDSQHIIAEDNMIELYYKIQDQYITDWLKASNYLGRKNFYIAEH